jgi:hypothetical protein
VLNREAVGLEGLHGEAEERHVRFHAPVAQRGPRQDVDDALRRVVPRRVEELPAAAEVDVVERDPQQAVHRDVGAQRHGLRVGQRRHEALLLHGPGAREVDERPEVGVVDAGGLRADEFRGAAEGPRQQVPRRGGRVRPEHEVARVRLRHPRHPRPPVHGEVQGRRGSAAAEAPRLGHAPPEVRRQALHRAVGAGRARGRPGLELRDELVAEAHVLDHHLVVVAAVAGAAIDASAHVVLVILVAWQLELGAAVLELDPRRVAGDEEGRPVVHRDGVDGDAAGGLAPGDQEPADGEAVADGVVHGVAHDDGAAREPRHLDQHQLPGAVAAARVEAPDLGRGLQRHDAPERGAVVRRRLDEPDARVVEQDAAAAGGGVRAEPAGPLAVLGQRPGEPRLEGGGGRGRRVEGVDAEHVVVEADEVERGERDEGGGRSVAAAVVGLDGLGRLHGDLHRVQNVSRRWKAGGSIVYRSLSVSKHDVSDLREY